MKKTSLSKPVLLLLPLLWLASSQPVQAITPVETDSSMYFLQQLSDPVMFAGRKSGHWGGDSSQTWIARQFAQWGLEPLLDEGLLVRYDQLVTNEKRARMVFVNDERYGDVELRLGEDFTACTNSGSGTFTAPVTLIGYGISRPEKGWDDYQDVDVKGKIVVIKRGKPNSTEDWDEEYLRPYLYGEAVRRGAAAVLFHGGAWPVNGAAINITAYNPDVPVGYIGDSFMRLLFTYSGTTWEEYQRELKAGPHPLPLDQEVMIDFEVEHVEDGYAYNVAGVVPGTDPELASEAVIIGGHGDHVGPNAEGIVYVGADDNGSGAATIMELARAYAANPAKRTLVFMVFGGEEQGLLGSRAIAPRLPDTYQYVNMLNLDMVGRGSGITGFGGGDQLAEVWDSWFSDLPGSLRDHFAVSRAWGGEASDHASFRNEGIPAFTIWSHGSHDYYHRPDDLFNTIERPAMDGALIATAAWIDQVANYEQPLAPRQLAQRVVWHQGTPVAHTRATLSTDSDIATIWSNMTAGYMGDVHLFPYPQGDDLNDFGLRLEGFAEELTKNQDIGLVSNLREMRRNARSAHGSVLLALEADPLTVDDSKLLAEWKEMGLCWLKIREPETWLEKDELTSDAKAILAEIKANELTVELPLSSAENIFSVLEYLGPDAVLRGSLSSFRDLKSKEVKRIRESGAHIIVESSPTLLKRAVKMADEFDAATVHLQPSEPGYDAALNWVGELQQLGLEDKEIVRWISGNMGRW